MLGLPFEYVNVLCLFFCVRPPPEHRHGPGHRVPGGHPVEQDPRRHGAGQATGDVHGADIEGDQSDQDSLFGRGE